MEKPEKKDQDVNLESNELNEPIVVNDVASLSENKQPTINKQKSAIKIAGAALGGFVAATALHAKPLEEIAGEEAELFDATEEIIADTDFESENQPFNPNSAPIAQGVNDSMKFDEAFATARQETGPGGVFMYHGEYYTTFYAEELGEDGNPIVDYQTVAEHDLPTTEYVAPEVEYSSDSNGSNPQTETYQTMAVDSNADGVVDAVMVDINEDGSADAFFTDTDGDGVLSETEVQYIHDPQSLTQPSQTADPSVMSVDTNADGVDDVLLMDANQDAYADAIGTDANSDHQIDESEVVMLGEGMEVGGEEVIYEGEVAADMPEDVSDAQLDAQVDDVANLDENFDEYNDWA